MPLRDLVRLLVDGTSLSVVFDEHVDGEFEGDLRRLTLRQALEAVLFPGGLDYDVQGSLVRVFPRQPRTRLFDVNYLNLRRTWQRALRGGGDAAVTTVVQSDPLEDLAEGVRALLSASGRMHVDRRTGLVQVTDFSDRLEQVAIYLEALQVRASRQVRIDAQVLEVTLGAGGATRVDWTAAVSRAGAAVQADARVAGLRVLDMPALIAALAEQGPVRTLAAPQVAAMNNEPAVMRVGSGAVSFDPASHPGGGRASAPEGFRGLVLSVTPQVASDGIVQLHIAPSLTAPVLDVVEADTVVRVQDGHTVVLAGLLRDRTWLTPGSGPAHVSGGEAREPVRSEIIILLTPTVVSPGARGAAK